MDRRAEVTADLLAELPASVSHALAAHAVDRPDALAFGFVEGGVSFADLDAAAARVAAGLAARGLGRGDRCALVLPTGADFVRAFFGAARAGVAPVVMNPSAPAALILRRTQLARVGAVIAADTSLPGAVTVAELIAAGAGAPPRLDARPDDLAFLQITSGTTGEPKAAMITNRSLVAFMAASRVALAIRPGADVFCTFIPLYHDFGLVRFVFNPMFFGCASHLVPPSIGSLRLWLETISRVRAAITGAPDFAFRIATRMVPPAGIDLRSLRYAGNGGEPVRKSTIEAFEARFGIHHAVTPGYGLAEATLVAASAIPGDPIRTDAHGNVSNGPAYPGSEVAVGGGAVGEVGEIRVRGPAVFSGYFEDEAATAHTLRDGWLHTGDIGALDADGHLYILGRERAMVKRGGALIAPREIEEAADAVPGVKLSAAIGVVRKGSEDLVVVAEVADETSRDGLIAAIAAAVDRAVGFAPCEVVLVPPRSIPRTGSGKVRHGELRRRLSDETLGAAEGTGRTEP